MDSVARTPRVGTSVKGMTGVPGTSIVIFRAEFPFPVTTKEWYTLALLGDDNNFQLHIKKQGELVYEKVTEWRDDKNLHPKGVLGIHTNQLQHYYIDNLFLYDNPREVNLAVEPEGKLAVTWANLKRKSF